MIERGRGDVINLASVSGKRPLALRTPYTASKMAVIGLTTTLGAEVGPLGVRVNSLSPGPVRGERMARNFRLESDVSASPSDEAEQAFASRATLGPAGRGARGRRGRSRHARDDRLALRRHRPVRGHGGALMPLDASVAP